MDKISNGVDDVNLSTVVSKANLVGNSKEWWVNTGVLVLLAEFVPTKRCSHLILWWTMANNLSWATLRLLKLKDKER